VTLNSSLASNYIAIMEVFYSDKHTSLLRYRITYGNEFFSDIDPWVL
jgi:hypothetical protein